MLTLAPLPTWRVLWRAMVRPPSSDAVLASPWHREGEVAGWLSRSTWSLALIALWRKRSFPAAQITVWVPDFFCNAALSALRQTGARLLFYPLTDDLAPDLSECQSLAADKPPDLFLLVHYFGKPVPVAPAGELCARHGAWLIEDAAHVLQPTDAVGVGGDFAMYSPHKSLPIPDGAVLVARPDGPGRLGEPGLRSFGKPADWAAQLGDLRARMGDAVASSQTQSMVWLVKRVLQKFGVRSPRREAPPLADPFAVIEPSLVRLPAPSPSCLSRRLLAGMLASLPEVADRQRRHQLLWDEALVYDTACSGQGASVAERPANREWTPYLSALRINPDLLRATYWRWQRLGLPVTTWPDLPPEVLADREGHARAVKLRDTRLYLSVHQSLGAGAILKKCGPLRSMTEDGHNPRR